MLQMAHFILEARIALDISAYQNTLHWVSFPFLFIYVDTQKGLFDRTPFPHPCCTKYPHNIYEAKDPLFVVIRFYFFHKKKEKKKRKDENYFFLWIMPKSPSPCLNGDLHSGWPEESWITPITSNM